jgi:hypothetical protein
MMSSYQVSLAAVKGARGNPKACWGSSTWPAAAAAGWPDLLCMIAMMTTCIHVVPTMSGAAAASAVYVMFR